MGFEQDYDVVVAGAGVAGVAAALECARAGMRTALVEKTVLIGGLATTGLVNFYLPLCDGRGHQVIYGGLQCLLQTESVEALQKEIDQIIWVIPIDIGKDGFVT